jgi:hypothetical protein
MALVTPQQAARIHPWLQSSNPNWAAPLAPPAFLPGPPNHVAATAVYDGPDRLKLRNDWFLIKDGDEFFLENTHAQLDIAPSELSTSPSLQHKRRLLMDLAIALYMEILGVPPAPQLPIQPPFA